MTVDGASGDDREATDDRPRGPLDLNKAVHDEHDEHGPASEISERAAQLTGSNRPMLIDAMGGPLGMAESAIPSIAFVVAITAGAEIKESAIIAIGLAVLLGLARAVRRQTIQFALTGVIGVAISAYVASKTGEAKNFFLPSFLVNVGYGSVAFISVAFRHPFMGYIVEGIAGGSTGNWRSDPVKMRKYQLTSLLWAAMFVIRLVVQLPLYFTDQLVALGTAKIIMGYPLFGIAIWLTWLVLRTPQATPADAAPAGPATEPPAR